MAAMTQARAREYFNYEPETGHLICRERPASEFSPARYIDHIGRIGQPCGCLVSGGYRRVTIDGKTYLAHKVAWLIVHGEWTEYPAFEIDHINGDRSDNRIQNLRKVTKSENQRNGTRRKNNKSGVNGVNWVESKGAWIARIWDGPHHRYLGQFYNLEEARQARIRAERELNYHEGHGKNTYVDKRKAMGRTLRAAR